MGRNGEQYIFGGHATDFQNPQPDLLTNHIRFAAADEVGGLYVLDGAQGDRVLCFDNKGKWQNTFSSKAESEPTAIAANNGRVYILYPFEGIIRQYEKSGALTKSFFIGQRLDHIVLENSEGGRINILDAPSNAGGLCIQAFDFEQEEKASMFVCLDGQTVRRFDFGEANEAEFCDIQLERVFKTADNDGYTIDSVSSMCVCKNGDIVLLCSVKGQMSDDLCHENNDKAALTNARDLLLRFDKGGHFLCHYGTGSGAPGTVGVSSGDCYRHSVTCDELGNLYSVSSWDDVNLIKISEQEGLLWHTPAMFDSERYSCNGRALFLAYGGGNLFCVSPQNGKIVRVSDKFFKFAQIRRLSAAGITVSVALPKAECNIGYDLDTVCMQFEIPPSFRRLNTSQLSYLVYDDQKNVISEGTFETIIPQNGGFSYKQYFTPPRYGCYSVVYSAYDRHNDKLYTREAFIGIAKKDRELPAMSRTPEGYTIETNAQAFSGLRFHRVLTTLGAKGGTDKTDPRRKPITDESLRTVMNEISAAKAAGLECYMLFEWAWDCSDEDVRKIASALKNLVRYYEIINEPDLEGLDPITYAKLAVRVSRIIKEEDPEAVVMGPCTCGLGNRFEYIEIILRNGGNKAFDAVSVHDYEANESFDIFHWQRAFCRLRELMKSCSMEDKPIFVTEHGHVNNRAGVYQGLTQAAREMVRQSVLESLGIPLFANHYYYAVDMGYIDYPAYFFSDSAYSGPGPSPLMLCFRNRNQLLKGNLPDETPDFGRTGNRIFFGRGYTVQGNKIWEIRNLGSKKLPLVVLANGENLKVTDHYGNDFSLSLKDGRVQLDTTVFPLYIQPVPGQSVTFEPVDFGDNLAYDASFEYSGQNADALGDTLNNGIFESVHHDEKSPWISEITEYPQSIDISFSKPQTVKKMIIYHYHGDNMYSIPLSYNVQFLDGDEWKTLCQVRASIPESIEVDMNVYLAHSFYDDRNFDVISFDHEVTTTALRLEFLSISRGFMMNDIDYEAFQRITRGGVQKPYLTLREIEIY